VKVTALTSSWEGSGALLANGDYYDWGYNAAGQLGTGSAQPIATLPVDVGSHLAQVSSTASNVAGLG
jgi:alpha-tubulin suppressor-like RCC1 family protein